VIIDYVQDLSNKFDSFHPESEAYHDPHCMGIDVRLSGHLLYFIPRTRVPTRGRPALHDREHISEFTESSRNRLKRYLRESVSEYKVFITLTYPGERGFNGVTAKRDLKVFLQRLRRYYDKHEQQSWKPYSVCWFMEFQNRGSVHFHMFTTFPVQKEWLSFNWYDVCGSEDERHLRAGTRVEWIRSGRHGISAYAAKYAAKQDQKVIPIEYGWAGRFWGVAGDRRSEAAASWVDVASIQYKAVKRQLETLENFVESQIFSNNMRYLETKHSGMTCIYIKNVYDINVIRAMIFRIEMASYPSRKKDQQLFDLYFDETISLESEILCQSYQFDEKTGHFHDISSHAM